MKELLEAYNNALSKSTGELEIMNEKYHKLYKEYTDLFNAYVELSIDYRELFRKYKSI